MNHSSPAPAHPPAPLAVTRLLAGWHWLEKAVAMAAYVLISFMLVSDVMGREFAGPLLRLLGFDVGATGIYGSQKIALYAMIVGSFLGLGIATATGAHLLPRIAFGWVPASWGPKVDRLADAVTGTILCTVAWYAWVFVESSREAGTVMATFEAPVWPIQAVIPLGFLSAALRYFIFALWPATRPRPPEFQE
ncbi:hypothetical protein ALDI51_18190 [Alicycliphilus denitrificans]|nr:TRAP transporter small permease subunit [Alicycliphilus denitrificans]MBN9575588.1 TRAP transporter small permease subunit [Alicycliphilus denitrificans]BCN38500.1 hypothetical protein ALDI51_18190 [Alicycliphilus denitrificans]